MTPIEKAFAEYNRHINSITTFAPLTVYDHFSAGYEAAYRDNTAGATAENSRAEKDTTELLQWFFDCRRVLIHCDSVEEVKLHWDKWKGKEVKDDSK